MKPERGSRPARAVHVLLMLVIAVGGLSGQTKQEGSGSRGENKMTQVSEFYCNTKALTKAERERYNQLTDKLRRARIETEELPNGYAFRLEAETVPLVELAEWIAAERKCCPFFGFEMEVESNRGPVWLKLTGKDGIKPFIRAEFGP
jgi:hypothetical protein